MNSNRVGFRFSPTDEELINHYLKNKVLGKHWLVDDAISEINIYSYDPTFLPSLSKIESNDLVWYFFSPYKSTTKRVKSRTTSSGFWKVTGPDRKIKDGRGFGGEIGIGKTLVYHQGRSSPNAVRTPWVMNEYHITCLPPVQRTYVICRIKYMDEARDVLCGDSEVSNEARNLPSGGSEAVKFPAGSNNSSDQMKNYPVGFRFSPTAEELINFYLKNKILDKPWLVDDSIGVINIYSYEPASLPALSKIKSNDLVWFFFSPCESTKKRSRTTRSGFWKVTGPDRKIKDKRGFGGEIGIKKTLVYHQGRSSSNAVRTPWVMHEYHITCLPPDQRTYVICQILYKGDDFPSDGNEVGNIPSAVNEVGNIPSAVNELGNIPSAGNISSDLCPSVVSGLNSIRATTITEMDIRQQILPSLRTPFVDSNTVRAANFAKMYELLQNLPSV